MRGMSGDKTQTAPLKPGGREGRPATPQDGRGGQGPRRMGGEAGDLGFSFSNPREVAVRFV